MQNVVPPDVLLLGTLPAGMAFYTNFFYCTILNVSISFMTSNQTLLAGRLWAGFQSI